MEPNEMSSGIQGFDPSQQYGAFGMCKGVPTDEEKAKCLVGAKRLVPAQFHDKIEIICKQYVPRDTSYEEIMKSSQWWLAWLYDGKKDKSKT